MNDIKSKETSDIEKPKENDAKNLSARISLIVIGSIIIIGGIVLYYIEDINCPTDDMCGGILHSMGGLGLYGLFFLGLNILVPGIIYPYFKRIKNLVCLYIFLDILLLNGLSLLLATLIDSLI